MAAQMVKEVASKTSDVAGDGTITATVLTQAIYREGSKLVAASHNPMESKRSTISDMPSIDWSESLAALMLPGDDPYLF